MRTFGWMRFGLLFAAGACDEANGPGDGVGQDGAAAAFEVIDGATTVDLNGVHVQADGTVWVVGDGPTVMRIGAAGAEPATSGLPPGVAVNDVWGDDAGRLVVSVLDRDADSAYVYAWDGSRWEIALGPIGSCLRGTVVSGVPNGSLYAACVYYPSLFRFVIGTSLGDLAGVPLSVEAIWASSDDEVFALSRSLGEILRYSGGSWDADAFAREPAPGAVALGGTPAGPVAVGEAGLVLRRGESGWAEEDAGTTANLRSVWGGDDGRLVAVGDAGAVVVFDQAWRTVAVPTEADLRAVRGRNGRGSAGVILAVGAGGLVLRATGLP